MGLTEKLKKWKRLIDSSCMTCRRILITTFLALFMLIFIYPSYLTINDNKNTFKYERMQQCIERKPIPFTLGIDEGNVNIRSFSAEDGVHSFFPFVGNGLHGVSIGPKSTVYLKKLRTLSLDIKWSPLYNLNTDIPMEEVIVSDFYNGLVHRFQCLANGLEVSYQYFSHRLRPYLFMQEIDIVNPTSEESVVKLSSPNLSLWTNAESRIIRILEEGTNKAQYEITSGTIPGMQDNEELAVAVVVKSIPTVFEIEPHRSKTLQVPCIIYSKIIAKGSYYTNKKEIEAKAIEELKNVSMENMAKIKLEHVNAWNKVWDSGLHISHSKAANALNGNKINATIYYVLSNVLPPTVVNNTKSVLTTKLDNNSYLSLAEGCYGGYHHTLQAKNLWKSLSTYEEINETASLWLLTLEKQGCQKLISGGYEKVMQALILSFGGFRFSGHHLEFKIDPKFLHRDFLFRRISYDGITSINISVTLQEDNKAILGVSLDNNDKSYYACDGGCIEEPVKLGTSVTYFPVKVTVPITSILYITSDKSHMELIKDTLHVHQIVEAPAYDHHVIALHRHGHHLGGLPVLFWASICFLIVIFHLFLFKLIFNEYCDKQDKHRVFYVPVIMDNDKFLCTFLDLRHYVHYYKKLDLYSSLIRFMWLIAQITEMFKLVNHMMVKVFCSRCQETSILHTFQFKIYTLTLGDKNRRAGYTMQKKSTKRTYIGTQFNKAMIVPPTRTDAKVLKPTYVDVKVSPSAQKIVNSFKKDAKDDLLKEYDGFVFMKQGNSKGNRYSTPLTINRNDYDDLTSRTKGLQQEERAKMQILNKRGREFYMRDLCDLHKNQSKPPATLKINDDPDEHQYNEAIKELSLLDKKLMVYEQFPEMKDFNKNAAACQVHAVQGLQIYQNEALKRLKCPEDKKEKYVSDLKSDDSEIVEEGNLKREENVKKLNLLLLLKCQLAESDLLKKIVWDNKQTAARENTKMDFETTILTLEDLRKDAKDKESFRKDLKNMIQYNKDLTRYKAMENKNLRKRETDFIVAKAEFTENFEKRQKQMSNEYSAHFQKVFAHTKSIMDMKALKEEQYKEWVIWDTEKKRQKEDDRTLSKEEELLRRKLVLSEREFLQSVKDQQKKDLWDLEMNEHKKNLKWLEFNDKLQSADPLSRNLLKDTVRYIVLDQINENEMKQLGTQQAKLYEGTLLKNYDQAYKNLVRTRQRQKLAEYRRNGMPMSYIGHLTRKFNLEE